MLTILMATHNGATTLNTVLTSYLELHVPKGGYKIVIVNNASADNTQPVLDRFKDRLPSNIRSWLQYFMKEMNSRGVQAQSSRKHSLDSVAIFRLSPDS